MRKTDFQKRRRLSAMTLAAVMGTMTVVSSGIPVSASLETDKIYETDYDSLEEATEAAVELSGEIADEGTVLLKNDGTLPLNGNEWVSLFSTADSMMLEGMEESGFHVYQAGTNVSEFSETDKDACKTYGDVAVVTISGGNGGEGKTDGYMTSEKEDNLDADGNAYTYADGTEFTHKAQAYDGTDYYKHPLQITDETEELISYVTKNYSKVVVILTGSSPIEAGILRDNENINAILWTGSLGESGWQGCSYGGWDEIAKLLNGEVNPSGKTTDLWAYDFTANTTWANDGNSGKSFENAQDEDAYSYQNVSTTKAWRTENGEYAVRSGHTDQDTVSNYYTVEYEEGIYYGYRYYETMDADYQDYDYDKAVAFPFGYGLSYTSFDWELVEKEDSDWGKEQSEWEHDGKITLKVKVTNTGDHAGKDVVEIYGHSPYIDGGVEKSEVTLVGFEKTQVLRPGQSEIVTIEVNIQDLASFDYNDANENGFTTYELDAASGYELRLQTDSHNVKEHDGEALKVALGDISTDIILSQDDHSGNEVTALFSDDNIYNSLGYDPETGLDLTEEGKMTLMSRSSELGGLEGTFPEINTVQDMTRSDKYYQMIDAFADYEADSSYGEGSYYQLAYGENADSEEETSLPWVKTAEDIPDNWDQMEDAEAQAAAKAEAGDEWLNFEDMKGVPYDDEKWTTLMNELTYDDMKNLISNGAYQTVALDAINKDAGRYMDSALVVDQELTDRGFNWGDCPHSASTWNKDLMYRRGVISGNIGLLSDASSMMSSGVGLTGWYAPAANIHRSPFGGRTSEYFSEDGYLSGNIAGNIVSGMASKGIICTIKHVGLNENETQRQSLFTYVSEQAMREVYMKAFQIVLQEYECGSVMTSYNNVGEVHSDSNYNFVQGLMRDEWGWNGFQCTDAVTPMSNFFSMDTMLRAGSNLLLSKVSDETGAMLNGTGNCAVSGTYDKEQRTVVLEDGSASATQWYVVRNAAQQILFTEANSKQSTNGFDLSEYQNKSGALESAKQAQEYEVSVTADIEETTLEYKVVEGELPEGLKLENGVISGTPLVPGSYEFTVEVSANGWIKAQAQFTLEVTSAISVNPAVDATIDAIPAGQEFLATVDLENAADFNNGVVYTLAEGSSLPQGMELSEDGVISGTPVTPGTYELSITATGSVSEENAMHQEQIIETSYTSTFTFVVTGDSGENVKITSVVQTENGYTVYFDNGSSVEIDR